MHISLLSEYTRFFCNAPVTPHQTLHQPSSCMLPPCTLYIPNAHTLKCWILCLNVGFHAQYMCLYTSIRYTYFRGDGLVYSMSPHTCCIHQTHTLVHKCRISYTPTTSPMQLTSYDHILYIEPMAWLMHQQPHVHTIPIILIFARTMKRCTKS